MGVLGDPIDEEINLFWPAPEKGVGLLRQKRGSRITRSIHQISKQDQSRWKNGADREEISVEIWLRIQP